MATETTTPSESTMNESIEKKMEDLSIEKIEDAQKEVDFSMPEAEEKEILKEEKPHEVGENDSPEDQQTREVSLSETEIPEDQDSLKVAETETPKKQDSHEIADSSTGETLKAQEMPKAKEEDTFEDAPEAIENETLKSVETPEVAEKEGSNEQVVYKDQVPADENASDLVAEDKWKKEASESAEADKEKDVNVAEVREVLIPTVDHRSGAGDESKTEDVPTTVVHETTDGEKPSPQSAEADKEKEVNVAEVREVLIPTVDHRSGAGDESKTEDVPTTVVHETTDGEKPSPDGEKPSPRRSGDIFQNVGSKMIQSVQKLKNVISGKSSNGKSSKSTD
uniref:Uncharacterized protein n=1 Tax=Picea sitchensis TaxID=3332 RepID=B8LPY3_PICSI|nr:unknown [Picea sitchensis]